MKDELDKTITRWLTRHGCEVFVSGADIVFVIEGFWGVLHLKQTRSEKLTDRLKKKLQKLGDWSYSEVVWGGKSSNWTKVKDELEELLG